jgi:flagellar protein FliS
MNTNLSGITALETYRKVGVQSEVHAASPHRLIQMLLEGALSKLAAAKGFMQRGDLAAKGEHIGWSISIIAGLKDSLNLDAGGAMAEQLDQLYDYMLRRLSEANIHNDQTILEEVVQLLTQISDAWQGIKREVNPDEADSVNHALG